MVRTIGIYFIVGGFLLWAGPVLPALAASDKLPEESAVRTAVKRRPMVVMKQTRIKGRVFLVSDKAENSMPAPDVAIEVRPLDEDKVLCRTVTDGQGNYMLHSLEVGVYSLKVGLLIMELKVESPEKELRDKTPIPKMIFVFLPKDMAKGPDWDQN